MCQYTMETTFPKLHGVHDVLGAPPPPLSAINRGIGTEGLGTVLAGLWGSGNGTNTFGENVGAIGVTKVNISLCGINLEDNGALT